MDDKNNAADPFEENLRHILSNDAAAPVNGTPRNGGDAPRSQPDAFVPDQEAIDRMKAEQRLLFFFKVLRPIAAAAFIAALAMFVARITAAR